jgi:hypothetical protein
MPIPSPEEFATALHQQAPAGVDPAYIDELTRYLLTAYDAVLPYQPLAMRPVQAPWGGAALAFEASWPDTHSLVVATRRPPEQGSPAQLTLRRAGQLVYAVSSTPEHLPTSVTLCLGRHIRRITSGETAE